MIKPGLWRSVCVWDSNKLVCFPEHVCDTHNELWGDDPVCDCTEEGGDDADADEDDGCHELEEMETVENN